MALQGSSFGEGVWLVAWAIRFGDADTPPWHFLPGVFAKRVRELCLFRVRREILLMRSVRNAFLKVIEKKKCRWYCYLVTVSIFSCSYFVAAATEGATTTILGIITELRLRLSSY